MSDYIGALASGLLVGTAIADAIDGSHWLRPIVFAFVGALLFLGGPA